MEDFLSSELILYFLILKPLSRKVTYFIFFILIILYNYYFQNNLLQKRTFSSIAPIKILIKNTIKHFKSIFVVIMSKLNFLSNNANGLILSKKRIKVFAYLKQMTINSIIQSRSFCFKLTAKFNGYEVQRLKCI